MKSLLGIAAIVGVSAAAFAASSSTEKSGTVKMYLMNPEGKVDGLLLTDGTQVHFPPHLSSQLVSKVKASESVKIVGESEGDKTLRADQITNAKGETLKDTPPKAGDAPPPPPPGAGPAGPGPHGPPPAPHREGLKEMSASGTVSELLSGRRGETNGVILSNNTIVHFAPKIGESLKLSKGMKVKVSGFGTKNEFGESIEATEVKGE